jgi:hypothetical protein
MLIKKVETCNNQPAPIDNQRFFFTHKKKLVVDGTVNSCNDLIIAARTGADSRVRFQNEEEWDGTVPHLDPIPVFGCAEERNQLVPQKGIFPLYAEPTHSTKSVEGGGTAG